jgi:hypothetical protein
MQIEGGMAGARERREAEDEYRCMICQAVFKEGEMLCIIPCVHQFHVHCIDGWFGAEITCTYGESDKEANEGCPSCQKPAFNLMNDEMNDDGVNSFDDFSDGSRSQLDLGFFGGFGGGDDFGGGDSDEDGWA